MMMAINGKGGKGKLLQVPDRIFQEWNVSNRRHPPELGRGEEQQEGSDPEVRKRQPDQAEHPRAVIEPGVALDRRNHAQWNRHQSRNQNGENGDLDGDRQRPGQQFADWFARPE
jgi:hypothetical protein